MSTVLALRPRRPERIVAVLAVAVLTLTACNDGPSGTAAPTDADVDAFCQVIGDLDLSDPEKLVENLVETGTPQGIPDDARNGFEVLIDKADEDKISDSDQEKVNAFLAYVASTCGAFPADDPTE